MSDCTEADAVEQQVRIHRLQNDAILKEWESLRKAQEIRFTPITFIVTVFGAVAALFVAATAFAKFLG